MKRGGNGEEWSKDPTGPEGFELLKRKKKKKRRRKKCRDFRSDIYTRVLMDVWKDG